jgi:hypothetical protein
LDTHKFSATEGELGENTIAISEIAQPISISSSFLRLVSRRRSRPDLVLRQETPEGERDVERRIPGQARGRVRGVLPLVEPHKLFLVINWHYRIDKLKEILEVVSVPLTT